MGALLELLESKEFRSKTGMYVGTRGFRDLMFWIRGFHYAVRDEPYDLDGFYEWLIVQFKGSPSNVGCLGIIASQFSDEEATGKLFECVDKFLEERSRLGLEDIVQRHADYERQRYGYLSTSRLNPKIRDVRAF